MATLTIQGENIETKVVEVADGTRLTNVIEAQGIDILHRCGGYGKCTTCRVTFDAGEPAAYTEAETAKLTEKGDLGDYRLSCQLSCAGEMTVNVMMTMASSGLDDAGPELSAEIPA